MNGPTTPARACHPAVQRSFPAARDFEASPGLQLDVTSHTVTALQNQNPWHPHLVHEWIYQSGPTNAEFFQQLLRCRAATEIPSSLASKFLVDLPLPFVPQGRHLPAETDSQVQALLLLLTSARLQRQVSGSRVGD